MELEPTSGGMYKINVDASSDTTMIEYVMKDTYANIIMAVGKQIGDFLFL